MNTKKEREKERNLKNIRYFKLILLIIILDGFLFYI